VWTYNDQPFNSEDISQNIGFVYEVTNLKTGLKYIGKKKFWSTNKLPPLKGKTKKRKVVKESDWKTYCGSNEEIKQIVKDCGLDMFSRKILRLCKSLGEMSYYEMKYQMDNDVLLKPTEYYNSFVGGKIHRNHLLKKSIDKI